MKKFLFVLALILLFFNGVSAIFGGWGLISDPSGQKLQIPIEWLQHTLFNDYMIPGIVLFVFNGLFSTVIFVLSLFRYKHYPPLVVFQGSTLLIWIIVQVIIIQLFHYLHVIYGSVGILLIIAGLMLWRYNWKKVA
jgi:hypothetical protein